MKHDCLPDNQATGVHTETCHLAGVAESSVCSLHGSGFLTDFALMPVFLLQVSPDSTLNVLVGSITENHKDAVTMPKL